MAIRMPAPRVLTDRSVYGSLAGQSSRGTRGMEYRRLGRSGLKVSPICLGTGMFGGPADEATARRMVARAAEAGINVIDTADMYNEGRAETIAGRLIAADRQAWVLASKAG